MRRALRPIPMPLSLPADLSSQVTRALQEDIGTGDLTANLLPAEYTARATLITREPAILCGSPWVEEVFHQLDPAVRLEWQVREGEWAEANQPLCRLAGPVRSLLSGERTALNFLQILSATATATRRFVEAVAGTGCCILDTRKTLPGLRTAQKYATRCGGADNHRMGLYDAVLIKENHIAAAGSIAAAVAAARSATRATVEVEVENLDELRQALAAGPDRVLLDEFSLEEMRTAVELARARGGALTLEASGAITLQNVRAVAETGVDYLSIGAITKHVQAVDLSMRIAEMSR